MAAVNRQRDVSIRRIIAASRVGPELPDLAVVAGVVGEELGVSACRLAVCEDPQAKPRWSLWYAGGDPGLALGHDPGPGPGPGASPVTGLRVREVRFAGELVGWLALPSVVIAPGPRRLLKDVLVVLGPVLHAIRLGVALGREVEASLAQAQAIASARRRTVARMDEQRRVLERNLHDGAQHHLVNLRLLVGLIEHQLATGDDDAVAAQLETLAGQIAQTEAVLYDTASGILPMSLMTEGLCAALKAEIGHQPAVTLRLPDEPRRYPQVVETAIFYACLEAFTNARKHAPGATVTITVRDTYSGMWFCVHDDGPGFDPAALPAGSGLGRLSDRVSAVGGTVTIYSAPQTGTMLQGSVPI